MQTSSVSGLTCIRHSTNWAQNWPMSRKRKSPRHSSSPGTKGRSKQVAPNSQTQSPSQQPKRPNDRQALRATSITTETASYEGPLPPADEAAKYEQILPGATDRLFKMAENYGEHHRELERQSMVNAYKAHRAGQVIGGLVVGSILAVCVYALSQGHVQFATYVGTGTLVALASIFVLDRLPHWRHLWRTPPPGSN